MTWQPIKPLSDTDLQLCDEGLQTLAELWREQRQRLSDSQSLAEFNAQMRRKTSIEAGLIERLYTIDRGITQLLVQQGIEAALIPHGTTDIPADELVIIINDHQAAFDAIQDVISGQRELSTSFIKQLHQLLTRHQTVVDAQTPDGKRFQTELLHGEYKQLPNNPTRSDGTIHHYCPPEHVAAEMDQLIRWYQAYWDQGVCPELLAAWLHHRFSQIHPFQDGNGRVARYLASLVLIKAGWFPLVVVVDHQNYNQARLNYITTLEAADNGNLSPLVILFTEGQKQAFLQALSLSESVIREKEGLQRMFDALAERLDRRGASERERILRDVEDVADQVFQQAARRLSEFETTIKDMLGPRLLGLTTYFNTSPASDEEHAGYYRGQIIEAAKQIGYYANLVRYKAWLLLSLRYQGLQTELLFSVHHLGRDISGVMIVTGMAYRRVPSEVGSFPTHVNVLLDQPFTFTYRDSPESVTRRFEAWMTEALGAGLLYWQNDI